MATISSALRALSSFCGLFAVVAAFAQQEPPTDPAPAPAMREISPGVFAIGKLILTKEDRSVRFPAAVNMDKGMLEYVLVTPDGSTHESLLVTEVQPSDLHLAMLLLGAKDVTTGASSPQSGQINSEYLKSVPKLTGQPVSITVKWKDAGGNDKSAPLEDWLSRTDSKKPVENGPWLYTGSMFGADGRFLAQQEGCLISVLTYPAALVNNPRQGNTNDQVWAVNEKAVPAAKTAVEMIVRLEPEAKGP